jgi:hypothetical protein
MMAAMAMGHGGTGARRARGWQRHLEGWQAGLVAILVAALGTALVVPREAPPIELPAPIIDQRALASTRAADEARAKQLEGELAREQAQDGSALFDLRALGSELRRYGVADAEGDQNALAAARADLAKAAVGARGLGEQRLLDLRAYELSVFLAALRRWERGDEPSEDLRALGGDFVGMARSNGWVEGRRLLPDEAVRAALFKRRWNELTGFTAPAFALSLDETRALYAFLLDHPTPRPGTFDSAEQYCQAVDAWRMRKVDELARDDASYPRFLARGVLFWRLGDPLAAVSQLREHLERHPDGPWALRARNYLRTALVRAGQPDEPL